LETPDACSLGQLPFSDIDTTDPDRPVRQKAFFDSGGYKLSSVSGRRAATPRFEKPSGML
jgi:hypothetical protein